MLVPTNPSTAGSRVTAASTVNATTAAEPMPSPLMNDRPMASMPTRAMITVEAGEQHGPPGRVDRGDHRLLGIEAGLEGLAVAGDDEQRVVDAHADADHGGQDGGEGLERVDVGEQLDDRQPDGDAAQRHHDGQRHGQHRPEGDEQDDDGGHDADQLTRGQWLALGLLDELTAEVDLECGVECGSASVDHLLADRVRMLFDFASSWGLASATAPDFEMPPGCVYGSLTLVTWSICGELGEERVHLRP